MCTNPVFYTDYLKQWWLWRKFCPLKTLKKLSYHTHKLPLLEITQQLVMPHLFLFLSVSGFQQFVFKNMAQSTRFNLTLFSGLNQWLDSCLWCVVLLWSITYTTQNNSSRKRRRSRKIVGKYSQKVQSVWEASGLEVKAIQRQTLW